MKTHFLNVKIIISEDMIILSFKSFSIVFPFSYFFNFFN